MTGDHFEEFRVGSTVQHVGFGKGRVIEKDASKIRVEYDNGQLGSYEKNLWHVYSRYLDLVRRAA